MTVLWLESGYTMKYCLSPWEIPRAQAIFHRITLLLSQYSYSIKFVSKLHTITFVLYCICLWLDQSICDHVGLFVLLSCAHLYILSLASFGLFCLWFWILFTLNCNYRWHSLQDLKQIPVGVQFFQFNVKIILKGEVCLSYTKGQIQQQQQNYGHT